ncbi:hypothetical protein [Streptomyces sp. SID11385]|uniref:hypothetical protein n=1 Tax=Streptomyces sp. SID11385 TaxID=2706031 RepID=UPI0013C77037|nr:hypothetical protein [Streptomyces sp. SID11385]NEA37927.1 hypothetical protein [Streptomyces sp. SID11385]
MEANDRPGVDPCSRAASFEPGAPLVKVAALVAVGDQVRHVGRWRTVVVVRTGIGALGGLFVVLGWEGGGWGRFRAGEELLLLRAGHKTG